MPIQMGIFYMKLKNFAVILTPVLAISLSTSVLAQQQPTQEKCATASEAEVKQLFDRWNKSLQTRDPDKVVKNYASNAVLLPTVSNKPRTNHTEIRDYFVNFLQLRPVGKIDQRYITIGCNYAIDNGLYTFTTTNNNQKQKVRARYSFLYQYINGQWLIQTHHSSKLPEPTVSSKK